MKALVLLFPHTVITAHEENEAHIRLYDSEISPEQLEKMFVIPLRAVTFLRRRGYRVAAIVHRDEDGKVSDLAKNFGLGPEDQVIDSGVIVLPNGKYGKWARKKYPGWNRLVRAIPEEELVVGGFHFNDCVSKFAQAAQAAGKVVKVSPLISDLFYVEHCWRLLLGFRTFRVPLPMAIDAALYKEKRVAYEAKWQKRLGWLFEPPYGESDLSTQLRVKSTPPR